ncbi:MAG: FliM/FliN family flagellar motor switch protein [Brevundimonas sp.]|jgi:flagellar motor switch protein FliM|nr:FliM/FliN family flagellar motor switch protein [Brevundimonas sp.]
MSKASHSFDIAGRAAQHCPELLQRCTSSVDPAPIWQHLGEALVRALPTRLAPVLGGTEPTIEASLGEAPPSGLCAHAQIALSGASGAICLTIEGAAMLRLVDLAFGGRGEVPHPVPSTMPPSADILVRQVEQVVLGALAETLARRRDDLTIAQREAGEREPRFAPPAATSLVLTVLEDSAPAWTLALTAAPEALPAWHAATPPRASSQTADPAAAPFADLPLPLSATLVDMRLSLSTVAALEPGMVLPVAVARAVPLAIGGTAIARGSVGAQDDRIAIKLTQIA